LGNRFPAKVNQGGGCPRSPTEGCLPGGSTTRHTKLNPNSGADSRSALDMKTAAEKLRDPLGDNQTQPCPLLLKRLSLKLNVWAHTANLFISHTATSVDYGQFKNTSGDTR
jgi:hypothetical protein